MAQLGLACNGTLTCDTRGQCSSTGSGGGIEIPAQEVVLAAAPSSIDLTPDAGGGLPPIDVTVRLTTKDARVGTLPPRPVHVVPDEGLQVACTTTAALSSTPCDITGWTYALQNGIYTASRVIRVGAQATSPGSKWDLKLATDDQAHFFGLAGLEIREQVLERDRGAGGTRDALLVLRVHSLVSDFAGLLQALENEERGRSVGRRCDTPGHRKTHRDHAALSHQLHICCTPFCASNDHIVDCQWQ